ncbi:MAG TPA: FAD-binding oxidoreductase [Leptolyngbyaceae cyanobacterium M65_K2018_010]|nr:FAD-binding oxidoreductase [Leptolyngbyaceae cyanobacterium M65_K2018_010]
MVDPGSILVSLLGDQGVVTRDRLAEDWSALLAEALEADTLPAAIAYPDTEAQLSEVMACAHRHQWRVLPCGSGSKLVWGGIGQGVDLVLSTARLNQVIDHAVGDMTLTAQAGVTLAQLTPQLAHHRQFLALDPAYPERATLGGLVATADTGALRQRYGGVRDMLIGLSLVRYDGQIAKAGGRVVKNVAGYDLMKLLTGSYGTLGIMTQVTFRLFPIQEASKTVVVRGPAASIQALGDRVRRSSLTPVALDWYSPALAGSLGEVQAMALVARFESMAAGVDEQVDRFLAMVPTDLTAQEFTQEAELAWWNQANRLLFPGVETTASSEGKSLPGLIAKIGLRPTAALPCLEKLTDLAPGCLARIHASSGIGILRLGGDEGGTEGLQDLRSHCEQAGGYLTLLVAPRSVKQSMDGWGYSGNALKLMKAIKTQFDPNHCLSPGRFVGGL